VSGHLLRIPGAGRVRAALNRGRHQIETRARMRGVPRAIRHVHGPEVIERSPTDLLVITIVRNGDEFLPSFLHHYTGLGVNHFLFLDNGSTDQTRSILAGRSDVTLLETDLPYAKYENLMKRYLVQTYSKQRWNLFADIDELFDYPGSAELDLHGLLGYLQHSGATAMVAQMLDMFASEPLAALPYGNGPLSERFAYYDISNVSKTPYPFAGRQPTAVRFHRGGIRRTVFGTDNGLTKAPLVFVDDHIETFVEWHHVRHGTIADITGVLMHYPFTASFYAKVEEAARTGRYGPLTSDEYRSYWRTLVNDPLLSLHRPTAQRYRSADDLVAAGFLECSRDYRQWVAAHRRTAPAGGDGC
jgi:hypothetical protein